MLSKAEFEALLRIETQARDFYNGILDKIGDGEVRDMIQSIRNDEEKHMEIAQRLIDLVSE